MASYRYYRLFGTQSLHSTALGFANLEMRATVEGIDLTAPGQTIYGAQTANIASNAYEMDETTAYWAVHKPSQAAALWWNGQDFGIARTVVEIELGAHTLSGSFDWSSPTSFTFEGSNDLIKWDVLLSVVNESTWLAGERRAYTLFDVWPSKSSQAFPDALPYGSLTGANGGPQSNKIAFEPEFGPSIDRRKGSYSARFINIELPPLTAGQYATWRNFYHTNLKNGSLPMTFPDPITKSERRFQFRQSKPGVREATLPDGRIKINFDLIRVD